MKKLTLSLLTLTIAIIAFAATDVVAQKRVKLVNGKANTSATVKSIKFDYDPISWSIPGKDFGTLQIKQTNSGKFKYEIRRGNEFLSSGHTTGSNIQVQSDGRSMYTITKINEEDKPRPITLSWMDASSPY